MLLQKAKTLKLFISVKSYVMKKVSLIPPVLKNNIKRTITCIRPARGGGAKISYEEKNGKKIFHQYGHAGAGWTRLLGSADVMRELVAEHVQQKNSDITILGAGCIGLLSAIVLTRAGYTVGIIADKIDDLTSDNAAGVWAPAYSRQTPPSQQLLMDKLNVRSLEEYKQISTDTHPFLSSSAARILPAYTSPHAQMGLDWYVKRELIDSPTPVLLDFGGKTQHQLLEYKSIFINVPEMMHQLRTLIKSYNISLSIKKISSFDEITSPVIINCTGLGAQILTHDQRLFPEQGHLIELAGAAPVQEYIIHAKVIQDGKKEALYYTPRAGGFLGVSSIRNESGINTNQHEFDRIIARAHDFFGI